MITTTNGKRGEILDVLGHDAGHALRDLLHPDRDP